MALQLFLGGVSADFFVFQTYGHFGRNIIFYNILVEYYMIPFRDKTHKMTELKVHKYDQK